MSKPEKHSQAVTVFALSLPPWQELDFLGLKKPKGHVSQSMLNGTWEPGIHGAEIPHQHSPKYSLPVVHARACVSHCLDSVLERQADEQMGYANISFSKTSTQILGSLR